MQNTQAMYRGAVIALRPLKGRDPPNDCPFPAIGRHQLMFVPAKKARRKGGCNRGPNGRLPLQAISAPGLRPDGSQNTKLTESSR
jgi:hypothetical protein